MANARRAVLVVALALPLAAVALLSRPPASSPPPPPSSVDDASATAAPGPVAAVDAAASTPALGRESAPPRPLLREAVPPAQRPGGVLADRAAIVGTVVGTGDHPVAGALVELRAETVRGRLPEMLGGHPNLGEPRSVTTAADGTFAFESLLPGSYTLALPGARIAEPVSLAAGQRREFVLECPWTHVVARVRRGGMHRAVHVTFVGPTGEVVGLSEPSIDRDGPCLHAWLAPGRWEVTAFSTLWPSEPLAHAELVVAPGQVEAACELVLAGTDVSIEVHDANGVVACSFVARIHGTGSNPGVGLVREVPGYAGRAGPLLVPPGRFRVDVRSPELTGLAPHDLSTGAAGSHVVRIAASRAARVRLLLRAKDVPWSAEPEHLPWLAAGGELLPCRVLVPGGTGAEKIAGWSSVPPGRATVALEDRCRNGEWIYLPFDPLPPTDIDVEPGGDHAVTLDVTPRAHVAVTAADAQGRVDTKARLELFSHGLRVNGGRSPAWSWSGPLPPGSYRVVVDRAGEQRVHDLGVDRAPIVRVYRP